MEPLVTVLEHIYKDTEELYGSCQNAAGETLVLKKTLIAYDAATGFGW